MQAEKITKTQISNQNQEILSHSSSEACGCISWHCNHGGRDFVHQSCFGNLCQRPKTVALAQVEKIAQRGRHSFPMHVPRRSKQELLVGRKRKWDGVFWCQVIVPCDASFLRNRPTSTLWEDRFMLKSPMHGLARPGKAKRWLKSGWSRLIVDIVVLWKCTVTVSNFCFCQRLCEKSSGCSSSLDGIGNREYFFSTTSIQIIWSSSIYYLCISFSNNFFFSSVKTTDNKF